jgi:hypothetical protein
MDAARKRNPIMHSTESLKQAEKTLANYALPSRRRRKAALIARSALTVLF